MIRKRYTSVQKAAIVLELLKEEETLPQIVSRHRVHPNLLRKWKAQALEGLPFVFHFWLEKWQLHLMRPGLC